MNAPTYSLRPMSSKREAYLEVVRQLTDWVIEAGVVLRPVVDAYAEYVELNGREQRRSHPEYLLEALLLGVLWRARGADALQPNLVRGGLVAELVRERRSKLAPRCDGSSAELVAFGQRAKRGRIDPTLHEVAGLLDWMWATREYDGEHERLDGWSGFLSTTSAATNREILRLVIAFAVRFEAAAQRYLAPFTEGVDAFLEQRDTPLWSSDDAVRCSRKRVEYHLNMVGAELLNRAWRYGFLSRRHHVVIMPACARLQDESTCRAKRDDFTASCSHCAVGCAVSAVTRVAERMGAQVLFVTHGSKFTQYLDALTPKADEIGIVGIACASDLLGSGWRARAKGFMAQCVLLNESGCDHWRSAPAPTSCDLSELVRVLDRGVESSACVTHRVA